MTPINWVLVIVIITKSIAGGGFLCVLALQMWPLRCEYCAWEH